MQEHVVPLHLPPLVSFKTYAGTLFPGPLLEYLESEDNNHREACARDWHVIHDGAVKSPQLPSSAQKFTIPPLSPTSYVTRWIVLLAREYQARLITLSTCTMYNIPVVPVPSSTDSVALFSVQAPHIRENYPPVSLNDTVWLRQLRPWDQTFQGVAVEARVHTLQRIAGQVVLRCDALAQPHMWESGVFNIQWVIKMHLLFIVILRLTLYIPRCLKSDSSLPPD